MKPLLQHLENESLLLLYMAGELPLEDRDELELMLERDGGLRAQLEMLEQAQSSSFAALAELDAAAPLRSMEPAMRHAIRAMDQWQVDRLARPPKAEEARSTLPIWGWSVGSAVAALLVFCIWWGFRSDAGVHDYAVTQPDGSSSTIGEYAVNRTGPGDDGANPVQVVAVDTSTQRLGELEEIVSEDFTRE